MAAPMGAKEYSVKLDELITARDNLLKHPDAYFGLSTAKEVAEALDVAIAGMHPNGMMHLSQQLAAAEAQLTALRRQEVTGWRAVQNSNRDLRDPLYLDGVSEPTGFKSDYAPVYSKAAPAADMAPVSQKPFIYGIEEPDGTPYMAEFCVSSDPGLLADEIRDMNADIPDGEPKYRVVNLVKAGEVQS